MANEDTVKRGPGRPPKAEKNIPLTQAQKDVEEARARREKIKTQDTELVLGGNSIPKCKKIQRIYAPETVGKVENGKWVKPSHKERFVKKGTAYKMAIADGQEPVIDPDTGGYVFYPGTDLLLMREPYEDWESRQKAVSKRSQSKYKRAPVGGNMQAKIDSAKGVVESELSLRTIREDE